MRLEGRRGHDAPDRISVGLRCRSVRGSPAPASSSSSIGAATPEVGGWLTSGAVLS